MRISPTKIEFLVTKHRYWDIFRYACDFVINHVKSYPVSAIALARELGISLYTYSLWAEKTGFSFQKIIDIYGNDGFCLRSGNRRVIAYNDRIETPQRINWTIIHEIGHLLLHLNFYTAKTLTLRRDHLNHTPQEAEADLFARRVIAPTALVLMNNISSPAELSAACYLSKTASENIFLHAQHKRGSDKLGKLACERRLMEHLRKIL